jgi:hypothetical protein
MKTALAGIALALALSSTAAAAAPGQLDSLKGLAGGAGSLPQSGSMSNAAGLLQYCMTNNYLGGGDAAGIKDKLLGQAGGDKAAAGNDAGGSSTSAMLGSLAGKSTAKSTATATEDPGYLNGAKGILTSTSGKKVDIGNLTGGSSDSTGGMAGMGDLKAKATKKACDVVLKQGKGMLGMGK